VKLGERLAMLPPNTFAIATGALAALALAFVPLGYRPFIYFQF
jgi:alginate O-acetyltransferase complex protein AlgI